MIRIWSFIELSFPICSFIGSAFYHFVLILFGTSLFGPSLYCPLSFSYSTTWSYMLFVLFLFWTSYFGPFSFCRLLFCPLILCPVSFLAFHYLVLRKFVLFHFVHITMWKTHVHLMLMTHGCRRYVFFVCLFCFVFVFVFVFVFCFCFLFLFFVFVFVLLCVCGCVCVGGCVCVCVFGPAFKARTRINFLHSKWGHFDKARSKFQSSLCDYVHCPPSAIIWV